MCSGDCKDFEWLIVDDGSADDTSVCVEQMKKKADFPISYHKKVNGGKHTALNYAYQLIKTPLTFIVDSADFLKIFLVDVIDMIMLHVENENKMFAMEIFWR